MIENECVNGGYTRGDAKHASASPIAAKAAGTMTVGLGEYELIPAGVASSGIDMSQSMVPSGDIEPGRASSRNDAFSHVLGAAEEDTWYPILDVFQGANVFQTIALCRAKTPNARLEQLIVRRGADVAASALIRIVSIPLLRTSIAHVLWGPLFHRLESASEPAALAYALKALRGEYVVKRRFGLRIAPLATQEDGIPWATLFQEQSYRHVAPRRHKHTIIIDLNRPLDQLRKGLDQKWRNCLNSAERNNLEIRQGEDRHIFDLFLAVYHEMLSRKRLNEPGEIASFMAAQSMLPDRFKLAVFVALEDGTPSAAVICSAIGRRGVYLFGATGTKGTKNKASYLLHWRAIEWLREQQCDVYDLHGSNAETNPGVYAFKMGLCGKNGREVEMMGHFEAYDGARMRLLMKAADQANELYKEIKSRYRGYGIAKRLHGRMSAAPGSALL